MKNKHYVGLMMDNTVRYVTQVNWVDKSAHWSEGEPALAMSKSRAEDLFFGLRCRPFMLLR